MKTAILASLALLTAFSNAAQADQLAYLAQQVAREVSEKEPYLSNEQKSQVSRQLNQIRAILNGGGNPGDKNYICTSRDNDGSRPYVIGYKDFASVIRIEGTTQSTLEACEQSLAKGRRVYDRLFVCGSRDNDGSRPFALLALNGPNPALKLEKGTMNAIEDCQTVLSSMVTRREGVLYCGSRDNDGSRPFVKMGYRFSGGFETGNDSYNSLAECIKAL